MGPLTYQRIVNASWLLCIAAAIVMPDVIFGLLLELFHLMLELAHLLFELIEATLDHFIEHTFETETHETQVIVFYSISTLASIVLFFLLRADYGCLYKQTQNLLLAWTVNKTRLQNYWAESAGNKFKLIAMFNVGLTTCYIAFSVFV